MKNKTIFQIIFSIIIMVAMITIGSNVLAVNEDYTVLKKTNEEYIIYLKSSLNKEFEFAYTNKILENDEELDYIKSAKDSKEGATIAYVDENSYKKYFENDENTYMWAKVGEKYLAKGLKIELSNAITEDTVKFVENTTKRIAVNTENKDLEVIEKDGIKYTTTTGKIEIKDNSNLPYYYVMTDITKSEESAKLMNLAEKISKMDSESTVEKLDNSKEFYDLYTKLLANIDNKFWIKSENMQISQPKESKTGDKYVVWIKQGESEEAIYDVQFMTCYQEEDRQYIKEDKVIKETSKLPITYDSMALFVILGVAVALFIVVLVIRNNSKKEEKK